MRKGGGKLKELTGWATVEGHWLRRKYFTSRVLAQIAQRIHECEGGHTGELVVVIEAVSPAHEPKSHMRALEVFGRLRVWDTPLNTGVLLYLALDRHSIEIIADRGVAAPDRVWEKVCEDLQLRLQRGDYVPGVLVAIDAIEHALATYCAPLQEGEANENSLSDHPVVL